MANFLFLAIHVLQCVLKMYTYYRYSNYSLQKQTIFLTAVNLTSIRLYMIGILQQIKGMNRRELTEGHKVVLFMVYVGAIFCCQLIASVYEQKIYKVPYARNTNSQISQIFTDNITPFAFTSGLACLIGYFMLKEEELSFDIPIINLAKVAACDLLIHILLITALLRTDYTTLIVVNSCSLLSVVIVGAFFSGVNGSSLHNDQLMDQQVVQGQNSEKIGKQKIWICLIVIFGIILFSYFSTNVQDQNKKPVIGGALLTFLIFAAAIILEGYRPDLAAQIKHQYHPNPLFLYFSISGIIFIMTISISLITWKISYFVSFILNHDGLLFDLTMYGLLNSTAVMFAYKLISIFRQHVYPLVSGTRKCFTVCLNIAWYGHHISTMQWVGIIVVFTGIMAQIFNNYNLASKILPNQNIINRQGKNYNKVIEKQWESPQKICELNDVQGI